MFVCWAPRRAIQPSVGPDSLALRSHCAPLLGIDLNRCAMEPSIRAAHTFLITTVKSQMLSTFPPAVVVLVGVAAIDCAEAEESESELLSHCTKWCNVRGMGECNKCYTTPGACVWVSAMPFTWLVTAQIWRAHGNNKKSRDFPCEMSKRFLVPADDRHLSECAWYTHCIGRHERGETEGKTRQTHMESFAIIDRKSPKLL